MSTTSVDSLSATLRSLCVDVIGAKYNCLDLHNISVFNENGIEGIQMKNARGRVYKIVFFQQKVSVFSICSRHKGRLLQDAGYIVSILSELVEEAKAIIAAISEVVEAPVEEVYVDDVSCLLYY